MKNTNRCQSCNSYKYLVYDGLCKQCTDIYVTVETRLNNKKYKSDMNNVESIRDDLKQTVDSSDMINIHSKNNNNNDYSIIFTPVHIRFKTDNMDKKLLYVGANKFWNSDIDTVELLNRIS